MLNKIIYFLVISACCVGTQGWAQTSNLSTYINRLQSERQAVQPRQHAYLVLPNDMRILVISDPMAKKSAVSVSVGVGLYSDPHEYRGLAHYLEHMLFLGSQKYPNPAEFDQFITTHQGYTNAFTANYQTNFQMTVVHQAFPEALDRFAQFFIAPLFDQRYMDKEIHAIQSEYDKNVQNTGWRQDFLSRMNISPDHPHHWCFQGNLQTLGHVPRQVMLNFYDSYYSANNMTAVIISRLPIDQLRTLATNIFSQVPNRHITPPAFPPVVNAMNPISVVYKARIEENDHVLFLEYKLPPPNDSYWQTKDLSVIDSILGSKQPGSLAYYLKSGDMITGLDTGVETSPTLSTELIQVNLTEKGFAHWQSVASGILSYIEGLKKLGPQRSVYENAKRRAELAYIYGSQNPIDEAVELSWWLRKYPADQVAERDTLIPEFSPTTYMATLKEFDLNHLTVYLFAPEIRGDHHSEFYNFDFGVEPLAVQPWIQDLNPLPGLRAVPFRANPYLPKNLAMNAAQDQAPGSIFKNRLMSVDLMRDSRFHRPIGNVLIDYQESSLIPTDRRTSLLKWVWSNYVVEALQGWGSEAAQAGYGTVLEATPSGFQLNISGYSDRLAYFASQYALQLAHLRVDSVTFQRVIEKLHDQVVNRDVNDAYLQAFWLYKLANDPSGLVMNQLDRQLRQVSANDLVNFQRTLLASGHIRFLYYGNMSRSQAQSSAQEIARGFGVKPAPAFKTPIAAQFPLGTSSAVVARRGDNNAWLADFQLGHGTPANLAATDLLTSIMVTPFYTHMRTEKQFGYIVFSLQNRSPSAADILLLIQSKYSSLDVAQEGNAWLQRFATTLAQLPDSQLESVRQSLVTELTQPPTSYSEELTRIQTPFFKCLPYDLNAQTAVNVQKLSRQDLVRDYSQMFLPPHRRELSLYVQSTARGSALPSVPAGETPISNLDKWRKSEGRWNTGPNSIIKQALRTH